MPQIPLGPFRLGSQTPVLQSSENLAHTLVVKIDEKGHNERPPKKSLIDGLSKRLLGLDFKSNHSIKWKCFQWIVKKILPDSKELKTYNQK